MRQPVRMYADSKHHNLDLHEWVDEHAKWELEILRRREGWVLLPIRWTVERTFAWLGRCHRRSRDRERSVVSPESFVKLAMMGSMLLRLRPSDVAPTLHYRNAG